MITKRQVKEFIVKMVDPKGRVTELPGKLISIRKGVIKYTAERSKPLSIPGTYHIYPILIFKNGDTKYGEKREYGKVIQYKKWIIDI